MLLTSTGTEYWLAGKPGVSERVHSSVSGFRKEVDLSVQENKFVRGTQARVLDRGNIKTTLRFSTTRKFNTVPEAEAWMLDYEMATPRTGTIVLESVLSGGGVTRRYLPNAVVRPPVISNTGVSVDIQYTVEGGLIKSSPT